MDWRILAAITITTWGAYNVILKAAAGRMAWQASMLVFVVSYSVLVGAFCLMQGGLVRGGLTARAAILPLVAGALCGIGAIAYFKGIVTAPGSLFFPLVALAALVSTVGCIVFLQESLTLRTGIGIACAAAAIVLLAK